MKLSFISPHPEVMFAPANSGKGMVKIIRLPDGGVALYLQTKAGLEEISRHSNIREAKAEAERL